MKIETQYFDVTPKIVPADRETVIKIVPRFDHCRFHDGQTYGLTYAPAEEFAQRSGWQPGDRRAVTPVDGRLRIRQFFEGEQEHVLHVEDGDRDVAYDFRVYSLERDLFARKPYKGDMHIHTYYSDGRESPAYVAAACRRIGLDFVAITDHRKYAPSLEAQRAYDGVNIDLCIYPGEEVHPPNNPVHIINFGGRFSINELFNDEAAYRASVQTLEDRLATVPAGVDRYQYASCVWCFDKIREGGGLGIFCHPYWFTDHRYSPSGALTSHLFDTQPFDAYEVIGGFHRFEEDSNTLQVARYHEERSRGRTVPIVGVSDAHGCERGELFGWYWTIVFAPTPDFADLAASIRQCWSVAVETLPGETPRAYGPFRLVKYALFLMRELFPQHDALCLEEGRLMLGHVAGNADAAPALHALQGRTKALLDRHWGDRT